MARPGDKIEECDGECELFHPDDDLIPDMAESESDWDDSEPHSEKDHAEWEETWDRFCKVCDEQGINRLVAVSNHVKEVSPHVYNEMMRAVCHLTREEILELIANVSEKKEPARTNVDTEPPRASVSPPPDPRHAIIHLQKGY